MFGRKVEERPFRAVSERQYNWALALAVESAEHFLDTVCFLNAILQFCKLPIARKGFKAKSGRELL